MATVAWLEWLGYLASVLVVMSLAATSMPRLRMLSLLAAVLFCFYGTLLRAWPVVVANAAIGAINVYHLWRLLRDSDAGPPLQFEDSLEGAADA